MHPQLPQANPLAEPILQLADAMPQLVWIADTGGVAIYFNSRIQEYKGARRNTDGTWDWLDAIHPDDRAETALRWQHTVATGHPLEIQHRMCLSDGSWAWHLVRAVPQLDLQGNVQSWIGTSTNIHRQKESEQTLRESEERFRLLTDSIPQIVWIVDGDGKTQYVNERWETYTGQATADVDRDGRIAMIHPDDLPVVIDTWQDALRNGEAASWDYRLRHQDTGRYRWFTAHVLPLRDEKGVIRNWICAANDVQAHKDIAGELEQQVERRTRELADLNEMLRRQTGELQRSNDDLQQFAHIASHDLKEPLRKIRTFGSRLSQEYGDLLPARGQEYLEKMHTSARRMSELVDGVLHYSLIDAMEYQLLPVDLGPVFQHIASDLEVMLQKTGAHLEIGALPKVSGITLLLQQLFFNLVHNALKFVVADRAPVIQVTSRPATSAEIKEAGLPVRRAFHLISVSDNGIGFDQEHAESIFKTFTRLHSKDSFEGTGLGLALCHKIVQRHGGAIHAEGRPGAGSVFSVLLQAE
ncbi:MAG: PAS domain-containing sensor histidine kinase [Chitinophagaceae bacterium]|nr:MAG: PAS domain-containing sensor histidine kinase [Chitinophagaceae bacterium]